MSDDPASLLASADVFVHNVERSSTQGMRVTLRLKTTADLPQFERLTRFRDGHAGGIYLVVLIGDDWRWSGELMMQGWSASHAGGGRIKFLLADEKDFEFLLALPRGAAAAMGMREVDDDGSVVDEGKRKSVTAQRGGPLSRYAAQLCREPDFLAYLTHRLQRGDIREEAAAAFIRATCNIGSRAELDHDKEAAATFHMEIREPYAAWLDQQRANGTTSASSPTSDVA